MNEFPIAEQAAESATASSSWADYAGLVASVGCAIHCAAMPLVLAYLPMMGLSWMAGEGFHQWMAVLCFGLAALAFVPGWRRHRSFLPAAWGITGVALLTTAAFVMEGSCCAACTSSASAASATTACTDAGCAFCPTIDASTTGSSQLDSMVAWLTPFVTPLGGLLLIVGHLDNRRKAGACQGTCCSAEEADV